MSCLKPTTKLDVFGDLGVSPEKDPFGLLQSKLQDKLLLKPPPWGSLGDTIELLAIENEWENKAMLQSQNEARQANARQSIINRHRIEEITKLQEVLRHRFIEANEFFKECDDKKHQANLRVSEEKQLHADLKKQIAQYKKDIRILLEFREKLLKTVADLAPYEKVNEEVVAQHDVWRTLKDCTDCTDALMMAQVEICKTKKQKLQEIEAIRQKMVKKTNEAALTVLGLNTKLSQLERQYICAKSETMKWEKLMVEVKDTLITNSVDHDRMLDGIQTMYKQLCRRRGFSSVLKRQGIADQMDFIRDEILILEQVEKECHNHKF